MNNFPDIPGNLNPMNNFPDIPGNITTNNVPERRLEDMDLSEFINYIEENSARLVEINQGPFPLTPELLNEFETIRSRRPNIEAELERRFPQEGFTESEFQHQEDFMSVEEPLGRFISNIASVEMAQAEQNNGPVGVDLVELMQRLTSSGIDTPEAQALRGSIDFYTRYPVDDNMLLEDLERRVNELIAGNAQPARTPGLQVLPPGDINLTALGLEAKNIETDEADELHLHLPHLQVLHPLEDHHLQE